MRDYMGAELAVDDWVVFITPNYRDFSLGKITKFTPKKIHVAYNTLSGGVPRPKSTVIFPYDVVRVEGPALTAKLLKMKG